MAEVILFRPKISTSGLSVRRCSLGLIYIATALAKKGFDVKIIDAETCGDWVDVLKRSIGPSTICAGLGVMTGYQIKGALDFVRELRKISAVPVVWGGLHPTILPDQTIEHELVDIIMMGEGEERFPQLVDRIKNKRGLDDVKGIAYKQNGSIRRTPPETGFLDLDTLPFPQYDLVDINFYISSRTGIFGGDRRMLDLNSDRGCPYRCGFCSNLIFNRRGYRAMSAGKVLDWIGEAKKRYQINAVNFVSDNFFVDRKRVYAICKGIIDRSFDILWSADMRIDTFLSYDDETIRLIKESGCVSLTFGIESGSQRMLDLIQKDLTVEKVIRAQKRLKEFGFQVGYHFMIGFPEETKKDIEATLRLMNILSKRKDVRFHGPSMYLPFPGTPLYDRCVQMGFRPPDSLEGWIDYTWGAFASPKLPWFSTNFKNYLKEVSFIAAHSHIGRPRSIPSRLFRYYCKLRHIGLMHGIRLYNADIAILKFLQRILAKKKGKRLIAR